MTFRTFIVKNALRNKKRTALTVLSIGFSLFLVITLHTFLDVLLNPPESDGTARRLAVRRSTALSFQMPLAYEKKLEKVEHVELVLPLQWFGGIYKDPKNFFANFGTDPERFFDMYPEQVCSEEAKRGFKENRNGCLVGEGLMKQFEWEVGDRITLQGTIFPVDLELEIVGSYASDVQDKALYFNWYKLNEALGSPDMIGTFWLMADSTENIPQIAETVDAMFRNSPWETKTETEKAFMAGFVSMLGNVQLLIASIGAVVLFTMMLVASSTMAMTIRERTREIGILKSLGYPRRIILFLILGEAVFLSVLGGAAGCLGAFGMTGVDFASVSQGFIDRFSPAISTYAAALGIGVAIGVISGLFPALSASRLTITEAMRSTG